MLKSQILAALSLVASPNGKMRLAELLTGQNANVGGAPQLLATVTASNQAAIEFLNLTADYFKYVIVCQAIVPVTNAVDFALQISTDNGANYQATNYYSGTVTSNQLGTNGSTGVSNGSFMRIFPALANTAGDGFNGDVEIIAPMIGSVRRKASWRGGASGFTSVHGAGEWATSTAVNAVRLVFSSGNVNAGTAKLYGFPA